MPFYAPDPLDAHLQAVAAVADAEVSAALPQEWVDLRARLEHFLVAPSPILQRLADAVIDGTGDVASLRAAALAEALIHAPEKLRKSWSAAEQLAHQLSEQITALAAAAALCGIPTGRRRR